MIPRYGGGIAEKGRLLHPGPECAVPRRSCRELPLWYYRIVRDHRSTTLKPYNMVPKAFIANVCGESL